MQVFFGRPFFVGMNFYYRPLIIVAIGWLIVATTLFCLPGSTLPSAGWMAAIYLDKWVHAGIFLVLYILWSLALKLKKGKDLLWLFLTVFSYGCIIEWVQDQFIVNRSFDVFDIVADSFGAAVGWVYIRYKKDKPL